MTRWLGARMHGRTAVSIGVLGALTAVMVAGCSSSSPPEAAPAPAPPPETAAPPVAAAVMAPTTAAGTYTLRTQIQRQGSQQRGGSPASTRLVLTSTAAAAPQMGAPATTFNATVQVPGYTRAPRGRSGQAAGWWPIPGDSLIVQFAVQQGDLMQLRGKLEGTALRGEIWYLSMESGATFQMGTFSAARNTSR
jgi:hypothetical protein